MYERMTLPEWYMHSYDTNIATLLGLKVSKIKF